MPGINFARKRSVDRAGLPVFAGHAKMDRQISTVGFGELGIRTL
jgi:hypothetical protein